MVKQFIEQKEKKVRYAELVYDLIFVYIVGRNNALLHHTVDGRITLEAFFVYIVCTLAVIQIWTYTTYYINAHGRIGARDYVFLFTNMFLMFFLARGTQSDWENHHTMYHIAWALILVNIGVQYLIELRHHRGDPLQETRIRRLAIILFGEAAFVGLAVGEFLLQSTTVLSVVAILFGMSATLIVGRSRASEIIDFDHLSERAMLYVVLTFGEMIIAIAGYFEGEFTLRSFYFAFMAFMIVVGLFLSYGYVFDHIVDREKQTNGLGYMFIHIFLIFALNNITSSLEFMRDEEVDLIQKIAFMVISLMIFFACLFAMNRYAKQGCHLRVGFYLLSAAIGAVFAALMFLFRVNSMVHIALTVAFVFGVFFLMRYNARKVRRL